MKQKVKVTVLDKKLYPELQKQYCADPESDAAYYFVVSTEEITNRRGYNGNYSVKIEVPTF